MEMVREKERERWKNLLSVRRRKFRSECHPPLNRYGDNFTCAHIGTVLLDKSLLCLYPRCCLRHLREEEDR